MTSSAIEFRHCTNPQCNLRYPRPPGEKAGERCPRCLGETRVVARRPWVRETLAPTSLESLGPSSAISLHVLLDNVRSAWNVGAIFRTADGLGFSQLYLCGITPTPPHPGIHKTALGAEQSLAWEYAPNAVVLAERLLSAGYRLWALEQEPRAQPLGDPALRAELNRRPSQPLVLIVGNETCGVDPTLLDLCECIIHIPMHGRKRSLNVEVAFALAAWELERSLLWRS